MADAICLTGGLKAVQIAATAFALSWSHSVEKTLWQEEWVIENGRLRIVEARVEGSGAGMEPPEGAILRDGAWRYKPDLPPQDRLVLAASGATAGGWTLCASGTCREIGKQAGDVIEIAPCLAEASGRTPSKPAIRR